MTLDSASIRRRVSIPGRLDRLDHLVLWEVGRRQRMSLRERRLIVASAERQIVAPDHEPRAAPLPSPARPVNRIRFRTRAQSGALLSVVADRLQTAEAA